MKQKISIKNTDNKVIFQGNILDLPIKEAFIIKKSIEIFDDDDPCIIHKSFVIKKVVDELLKRLPKQGPIALSEISDLDFLDFDYKSCTLNFE